MVPRTNAGASAIHPLHALMIAGALPLFLGGLLSDVAYARSYEIQWTNFAQWLLAGAMVFAGFALLGSLLGLLRRGGRTGARMVLFLLLLAVFLLGLVDCFVHTKDVYAVMPEGLVLSAIVAVLALAAAALGFARVRQGALS